MALFYALLKNMKKAKTRKQALEALAALRAEYAIRHAISGFNMDFDEAIDLLKNTDNLSEEDSEKRYRLVAAVDNLTEFAACAEYQLMKDVYAVDPNFDFDTDDLDFDDEDAMSDYVKLCEKYNKVYAAVENSDIEYAMAMAWRWLRWNSETYLTYMTQNDDRVRPWHYALQGFTAKRDDFPAWMIPPIEWGCRCFLVNDSNYYSKLDIRNVQAKAPEKPKELDGVFAESVCKCGRIFSKSHHYFNIDKKDTKMLKGIVKNIRKVYYGKKD